MFIDCKNGTNIIKLQTNFTIASIESDKRKIDILFASNGTFINESKEILSQLFEIPINLIRISEIININNYNQS